MADEIKITVLGPNESLLRAMPKSTLTQDEKDAQFLVIRDYLWHSGDKNDQLTEEQVETLFEMGDGYGPMDRFMLYEMELMWDWSHIRDSTDMALENIYNELMRYIS